MIIPLTQGKFAVIDDADAHLLAPYKSWYYHKNKNAKTGYAYATIPGSWRKGKGCKIMALHRLIMGGTALIDHLDRDGLNNRRSNLRFASQSQNMHNNGLQKNNTLGVKGIHYNHRCPRKPWRARIMVNGKMHSLGGYSTKEEAALAYNQAASRLVGTEVVLNQIS